MINKISYQLFATICALLLIIGGVIGWISFLLVGDFASNTEVVIISRATITKLEQERIKGNEGDMFFGNADEAIKLIKKIGKMYERRNVKTVFVNDDTGSCSGGIGISREVHAAIIEAQKKTARLKK